MSIENFFISIAFGMVCFLIGSLIRTSYIKDMIRKASITPFYWKFVIPFVVLVCFSYVAVFIFVTEQKQEIIINLVGQMATLIFAIFVGWYAFIQVINSQAEKTIERAHEYFVSGAYERAKKLYLEAYNLKPDVFSNTAELVELYIVTDSDEDDLKSKLKQLETVALGYREKLVVFYLKTISSLLREDLGTANSHILATIRYVDEHPTEKGIHWEFAELKNSKRFKDLKPGSEALVKINNYLKFLEKSLPAHELLRFKEGDYLLR